MDDDLRPEYDLHELLKDGVRGKYVGYRAGGNLALLAPHGVKPGDPKRESVTLVKWTQRAKKARPDAVEP